MLREGAPPSSDTLVQQVAQQILHAVTMCGALTLVFLLGSASTEKQGYDSSQGLFFYQHIAKTGGTSLGES